MFVYFNENFFSVVTDVVMTLLVPAEKVLSYLGS